MTLSHGHDVNAILRAARTDAAGRALANPGADLLVNGLYDALTASSGTTARWEYTVPAGCAAILEGLYLYVQWATTAGQVLARVDVNRAGAGYGTFAEIENDTVQNRHLTVSASLLLRAGDQVRGVTNNGDPGVKLMRVNAYLRQITL